MAIETFTLDVQRFVTKAQSNLDLVVRKVALDLFTRIIIKSPVDTGRFKGNWQVSINSIPSGTLNVLDKDGSATLSRVQGTVGQVKAGDLITLVNNLPYAVRLEYGWSTQAPAGMVRLTIQEYSGVVTKAAASLP
jgi:hypothetical protein